MPLNSDLETKRAAIRQKQWKKLQLLLQTVLPTNAFWQKRLKGLTFGSLDQFLKKCPFLTKKELVADREASPPYGTNLTYPIENYTRFCQTSGTSGTPMAWLDSAADWKSLLNCWETIYGKARLEPGEDRIFFPFSFGPFLGFWTAYEAAVRLGCMVLPGGGMSSEARLEMMLQHHCTVLCTTPTYALHLGQLRRAHPQLAQSQWAPRLIIVAGEPGGSQPETRRKLEAAWPGTLVFDHHGLTETGPLSYQDPKQAGRLLMLDDAFFSEIIDPATGQEVGAGETGELVVTTLSRLGCPLLRYRTGDQVRKGYTTKATLALEGGVLGRLDDMVQIRGVNIFPSAVEAIIHSVEGVGEYQVKEKRRGALLELQVVVEPVRSLSPEQTATLAKTVAAKLRNAFSLRIPVSILASGELPRFEFKARRWIKEKPRTLFSVDS